MSGAVYHPGRAVPECYPNAICSDDWRSRKAGCVEIAVQFRLDRPSPHQLAVLALSAQFCPIFADTKDIGGTSLVDGKGIARLDGRYRGQTGTGAKWMKTACPIGILRRAGRCLKHTTAARVYRRASLPPREFTAARVYLTTFDVNGIAKTGTGPETKSPIVDRGGGVPALQ